MRRLMLAIGCTAMVVPSLVLPATQAEARKRYAYREWRDDNGRLRCRKPDGEACQRTGTGLLVGHPHRFRTAGPVQKPVGRRVLRGHHEHRFAPLRDHPHDTCEHGFAVPVEGRLVAAHAA